MALPRSGGILLHPTSLPGGHGCGDFGPGAYSFLDYLRRSKIGSWQMLPLGPTGREGSPYQARSSFAGNPLLISLDKLKDSGLLEAVDLTGAERLQNGRVDFIDARQYKYPRLRQACENFAAAQGSARASYDKFLVDQKDWLEDYALFAAVKEHYQDAAWWKWADRGIVRRNPQALGAWKEKLAGEIEFQRWLQFVFYVQWGELKRAANKFGIQIIGDVPIYTAHDSADVWAEPELFEIDPETGVALKLAGAPPDYFCEDGQLWGNPIYRWDKLRASNYAWWMRRMKAALVLSDIVRIDHFRGFEAYWEVRAGEKTARNGKWVKGPGQEFFDALKGALGGNLPLIAEDLGVITPEVEALRDDNDLPGMKILQFAFCSGANAYRPHTYSKNSVVYTGTHDNDTTRGWYLAQGPHYAHMDRATVNAERDLCRRYIGVDGANIHWDLIRLALASVANTAVIPMQDVLGLGNESRMNLPGTAEGNWGWRMSWDQLTHADSNYLALMAEVFDRVPKIPEQPAKTNGSIAATMK